MVIIDQLRISDDGQELILDAHVNRAEYFKDVYIHKVTVLTEDQVSETDPLSFSGDWVYQEEVGAVEGYRQIYDRVKVLSARALISRMLSGGGWKIELDAQESAEAYAASVLLSGKFSVFGANTPKLVVATADYKPETEGLTGSNVLFTLDGELPDKNYDSEHPVWRFKGKGDTGSNTVLHLYLYKTNDDGTHELVRLDETDDVEFLHFYYMPYSLVKESNQKEMHLRLNSFCLNEKFTKKDLTDNMFFVYIQTKEAPSEDVPCRLDEATTLGVTFDYGLLYNNAMCYTRELADTCSVPSGFIDFILNFEALKIAVETEHYVQAVQYYKWLKTHGCGGSKSSAKPCGCHG